MEEKKTRTRKSLQIHKYEVIIDDGTNIYKEFIPATSEKELREVWGGNGEIIRIKEVPDYLPDASRVRDDLKSKGYGDAEVDFVYRILHQFVVGTEA